MNHVPAKGGSLDGAGPAIAGGLLITNSGYSLWKGMPGNVLPRLDGQRIAAVQAADDTLPDDVYCGPVAALSAGRWEKESCLIQPPWIASHG